MPEGQSEPLSAEITYDDFRTVDIRVGTIVAAEPFPEARRPAYKLTVGFWPAIGTRRTSVQITQRYTLEELQGKQVAAVINFPKKQIGRFMSEVLVLGFPDENGAGVVSQPRPGGAEGGRA